MRDLAAVLLIGFLIATPQLWQTLRYWPRSRRVHQGFAEKTALGNIPLLTQLRQMVWPTTEPVDGVFGTEACTFIGLPALLLVPFTGPSIWWLVLGVSMSLALGKRFPLFKWTQWFQLRIPARYCYFIGLSLGMLSLTAIQRLPQHWQAPLLLLQGASLLLTLPRLWPMLPYCQRWERPSRVFDTPLTRFLSGKPGRVSGLPYPLRTGQVNQLQTLGYNGGSQAAWMARFREDPDPNGSGAHDWCAASQRPTAEDIDLLSWYGVRYAYTMRPLRFPWQPTGLRHLWENPLAQLPPVSWQDVHARYG